MIVSIRETGSDTWAGQLDLSIYLEDPIAAVRERGV